MIDNLSECQKAAKQLNFPFEVEEDEKDFPGGCYASCGTSVSSDDIVCMVWFNKNLKGESEEGLKPICSQGKYNKYIIQFLSLDNEKRLFSNIRMLVFNLISGALE